MNLTQIRQDIYLRCKLGASPSNDIVQMVDGFINQRHRDILSSPGIDQLRNGHITFESESSVPTYALPPQISQIKTIYDPANLRRLTEQSLSWLRSQIQTNTGLPRSWIPLGETYVLQQPEDATAMFVTSTSPGDNASATIEYTRTGGFFGTATVTMTGTTPVQIGTANDIISVEKFYLAANAVGTVTLQTSNANGAMLSTIATGHASERFNAIQIYPTPSSNTLYHVDYVRDIPDLVNGADEPLLPRDFHRLVAMGARLDMYEFLGDDRRTTLQPMYDKGITTLLNYVCNHADLIVVPGGMSPQWSLGPWYPSERF